MKTNLILKFIILIITIILLDLKVIADAKAYKYKNCIFHRKHQVSGFVGRFNVLGQQVTGPQKNSRVCNGTVSFDFKYYESSTLCGFAKASSGPGGCSSESKTYCGSKYISGNLPTNYGYYYLAAGNYSMGSGNYFFSNTNSTDTLGLSSGYVNAPIIDIDYFGTQKGKIMIPTINAFIAVKSNSDFGQLFRIVVFSALDSIDTPITPEKVLWEASIRFEHGQLNVTGGFLLSDFGISYTTENITDSCNNILYSVPAMKAFPIGNLLSNGLSIDIQNDIINALLLSNPRQVPYSVFQNANADNIGVEITVASGYGDFVDDIAPAPSIPTLSTTITNVSCFGASDGAVGVTIEGGIPPYSVSIENLLGDCCTFPLCPESCNYSTCRCSSLVIPIEEGLWEAQGLQASEYIIEVIDDIGTVVTDTIAIIEPPELQVFAGTDVTISESLSYTLSDASVFNYSALFWETSGNGFFDDNTALNAVYTPGTIDITSGSVELCITAYPLSPCTQTVTDCMVLSIQQASSFIQDINLQQGWLGISSYIVPDDPSIVNVLAGIEDEMKLILMQTPPGFYWPGEHINTIGNWDPYKGYKIKMNEPALLGMNGVQVNPPEITLPAGSHFLPVLSPEGADISLLTDLGDDLLFAYDLTSGGIYWPAGGLNTLTSLEPGHAPLIRLLNSATFNFSGKSAPTTKPVAAFVNTTPWNDVTKTGDAHIISISKQAMTDLAEGDVMGVFNHSGLCVGMNGIGTRSENTAIIAFGDDFTTPLTDGLETGENMTFRLYRPSTGQSADLYVTFDAKLNTGTFEPEAVSMITGLKVGSLGVNEVSKMLFDIYPNPSTGVFNIVTNSKITIQVMNVQGQTVNTSQIEGNSTLDLSSQPKGIYFIKLEMDNSTFFKKLVIN